MQRCPKCDAMLSPNSVTCTLCGASVNHPQQARGPQPPPVVMPTGRVPPPVGLPPSPSIMSQEMPGAPRWAKPAYNVISAWWAISGIGSIILFLTGAGGFGLFGAISGGVTAMIGIGLLLRIEFIRGIVNFVCAWQILTGLLNGLLCFAAGFLIGIVSNFVQAALAGFMVYLIGETDTRAPNF